MIHVLKGAILACFKTSSILPQAMEKFNKSHRGKDTGQDSSLRIRLQSVPAVFLLLREFKTVSTSEGAR